VTIGAQQMVRQSSRGLLADSGKLAELADDAVEGGGQQGHICTGTQPAGLSSGEAGDLQTAGQLLHLFGHELLRLTDRLIDGGNDQILQHFDVAVL